MPGLHPAATRVNVRPELRTSCGAYALLDDVTGPVEPGDLVHFSVHGEIIGTALVTDVEDGVVYLQMGAAGPRREGARSPAAIREPVRQAATGSGRPGCPWG